MIHINDVFFDIYGPVAKIKVMGVNTLLLPYTRRIYWSGHYELKGEFPPVENKNISGTAKALGEFFREWEVVIE